MQMAKLGEKAVAQSVCKNSPAFRALQRAALKDRVSLLRRSGFLQLRLKRVSITAEASFSLK